VTRQDIMSMGAGGLIKHPDISRGTRQATAETLLSQPTIGVVVPAAVKSLGRIGGCRAWL